MTFPVIGAQSGGGAGTGTSTVNCTMPEGIVAGDLLIAQVCIDINAGTIADGGNGWTSFLSITSGGNNTTTEGLYKIAAGSDALSIARGSSCLLAYSVLRITAASWHGTTPPEAAAASFNAASAPDAPSLSPSWGAEDTLFAVGLGWRSITANTTVFPANYDTSERVLTGYNGNGTFCRSLLGFRELNASSDNPAAWNNGNAGGQGVTMAIRPKAGTVDVEKKFYLVDAVPAGATLHRTLQERGTAPVVALTTTGWVMGTHPALDSHIQNGGSEVVTASASWLPNQPSLAPSQTVGDCWRSENTITGTFANAPWYILFILRSTTAAYTGRLNIAVNIWKAANANGASATQLNGARVQSPNTTANLGTATNTPALVTWNPGATTSMSSEYLFIQVAVEVSSAGGGATQDGNFIVGPSAASSFLPYMLTPVFSTAAAFSAAWARGANSMVQPGVMQG